MNSQYLSLFVREGQSLEREKGNALIFSFNKFANVFPVDTSGFHILRKNRELMENKSITSTNASKSHICTAFKNALDYYW